VPGPTASPERSPLAAALAEVVGPNHVLTDPATMAGYATDWTGRFVGRPALVVRPADAAETAEVLRRCAAAGSAVVPQGGNTGLVGGGVALDGEVTLSLTRLAGITDVDPTGGALTAGAGATLAAVHHAARAVGWGFGVDLGARERATVGGMVATNAGGLHVLRHGPMRRQLLGIEAITADGAVIGSLRGLDKDNTGYDLGGLLCGSEGTLAVITRVRLRLVARPADTTVALVGLGSMADAVALSGHLRRRFADLSAAEFMLDAGLDLVERHLGLAPPLPRRSPVVVLVEAAGAEGVADRLAAAIEAAADDLAPLADAPVAVATDPARAAALWRHREAHTEAIATLGPVHKLDVTLPWTELAGFVDAIGPVIRERRPGADVWLFGHLADGTVHVNVTGLAPDDDVVDDLVLGRVAGLGGSISAEHGIGRAKNRWLHLNRTPAELAVFAGIRRALDPSGCLNPAVLRPTNVG